MASSAAPSPRQERLGYGRLLGIDAFWFGGGVHWQPIFTSLIPASALIIVGKAESPALIGRLTAAGGVLALLVPLLVGYLSDRTRSRFGRRRPWMVGGTLLNIVGLYAVGLAATPLTLILAYLLLQGSNNVAGAAYSGVIPDVVPEAERGRASGLLGTMIAVGTVVGVGGVSILLLVTEQNKHTSQTGILLGYTYIAVFVLTTLVITCLATPEQPSTSLARMEWKTPSRAALSFAAVFLAAVISLLVMLATSFTWTMFAIAAILGVVSVWLGWHTEAVRTMLRPLARRDFLWVVLTRAFTQMGIFAIVPFMALYFSDVVRVPDGPTTAGFWLLAVLGGSIVPAVVCGHLSDKTGRRKIFVYGSAAIQAGAVSILLFGLITNLGALYVIGVVYGIGYGTYYSVDWALACDVLPEGSKEAGKDMALYHVAFTLPQVLAPAVVGPIVTRLNHVSGTAGYRFMFFFAAAWFVLGTVMVRQIRGVR